MAFRNTETIFGHSCDSRGLCTNWHEYVATLLLLLLTAIELPLGSSSPYTSTNKTNNKYA